MVVALAFICYLLLLLVIIWKPACAMAPVLCMFGIEQLLMANSSFFLVRASLVNYAIGLLVLAGLISSLLRGGKASYQWPLLGWMVLTIHAFYAASFFWSVSPQSTSMMLNFSGPYTLTVSFALALLFRDLKDLRIGLLLSLCIACFVGILLLLSTSIHSWGRTIEFAGDIQGSRFDMGKNRANPLAIADLGAAMAIIALLIQFPKSSRIWSVLRWLGVFVGAALIFRSGSRGQLIGLVIAGLAFYKFAKPRTNIQSMLTIGFSVVAFGGVIWLALGQFGDSSRFDVTTFSSTYGETRGSMSAELFDEYLKSNPLHWLFGLGGGASWGLIGTYPHVVPIEVFCELGFFGFAVYLSMLLLIALAIFRLGKCTSRSSVDRGTVAVVAALIVFNFIMSFKQGSLLFYYYFFFLSIALARVEYATRRAKGVRRLIGTPEGIRMASPLSRPTP